MIFVDTSFWMAARNGQDRHHAAARSLLRQRADEGLVTSRYVRSEAWTLIRRRRGHRAAVGFLDVLERTSRVVVVGIPDALEDEAARWLRRHDEREYSFVDATSFALMRSLRLREAFAFDGDFSAAGFVELRP